MAKPWEYMDNSEKIDTMIKSRRQTQNDIRRIKREVEMLDRKRKALMNSHQHYTECLELIETEIEKLKAE